MRGYSVVSRLTSRLDATGALVKNATVMLLLIVRKEARAPGRHILRECRSLRLHSVYERPLRLKPGRVEAGMVRWRVGNSLSPR